MTLKRFIQYCLIGSSGVFVDMFVLYILCDPRMLGGGMVPGKMVASELAIINNFIWNDLWTFRDCRPKDGLGVSAWQRLARFNVICGVGLGLNVVLLTFLTHLLHLNLYLANLLAILTVTFWNFSLNYCFNWRG
jgi:dolichol-phosphate mannosyltransferase